MGSVCSFFENRASKPTGLNRTTTDIGVSIIKSSCKNDSAGIMYIFYSSDENIVYRPKILTISRQGHENIVSSSNPAMQISTPIINYVDSGNNPVKLEQSHIVNDITSGVGSYQTYANVSDCDLNDGHIPHLNVWNGDCSLIASVPPNHGESNEKDERLDMELENTTKPVGGFTPVKVSIINWSNNQRSVTNKIEQTAGNVFVEGVFNISENTRRANKDEKTDDEFSYYPSSPQSQATYETVDIWSDNERSSSFTKTPLLKEFQVWPKSQKISNDIFQFAQQEVSRTQNVASKLDDKLEKMDSLVSSVSSRFIFSQLSLEKSESIDKLEEDINNIMRSIRDLRRRSVSMLISDKDVNSSTDDLTTTYYLDAEREISSLQERLILLEKHKQNMISDLQMNVLQFGECSPLKMERSIMVVNEDCSVDSDMQGTSCRRTNKIGKQSNSIKTCEL